MPKSRGFTRTRINFKEICYGNGFTLVELLVVIAIMTVTGVYALSNYRSFGQDRNLKNAVLDIQSLLRQAQTNATTNVICAGVWQAEFAADKKTINLKCSASASPQRILQLDKNDPNISISSVSGTSCMSGTPFTIGFVPPGGNVNFIGYPNCALLAITLTNTKNTRSLIVEQGGRIYEQ